MLASLPLDAVDMMNWSWDDIEPYYRDLESRSLGPHTIDVFLADWSTLNERIDEMFSRLYVATTCNTADKVAERRYTTYLDTIHPSAQRAEHALKEKLLASGLEPEDFGEPLRRMRAEAALFREVNLPLLTQEKKLESEYDRIIGAQTVEWEGRETPLPQLQTVYEDPDRERRERAWRLAMERRLADRAAIDDLWQRFMGVRLQLAKNADLADYRSYRWHELLRLDYTTEDARRLHEAIEEVVVPAVSRIYERRRGQLGVDALRPWDLEVDPLARPPLRPYSNVPELEAGISSIFHRVDPALGAYFETMRQEGLLDLENRKNKAPGGYQMAFVAAQRPFIFMNAVGVHDDVITLLHEGGHSFHVFEMRHLPYVQQRTGIGLEFAEIASMAMEFLAAPYLSRREGGFYSGVDAARARVDHLERAIILWSLIAAVDAFQHWIYENPERGIRPSECDARWSALWQRFMPGIDWSELEDIMMTGWHRILHIHAVPFYIVEYGLAQLGAVQIWANALHDQVAAVASYRRALSLGGTRSIPQLYEAAGAKLAFDADTLRDAVDLLEQTIEVLRPEAMAEPT